MTSIEKTKKIRRRDQLDPTQIRRDLTEEVLGSPGFVYPLAAAGALGVVTAVFGPAGFGLMAMAGAAGCALLAGGQYVRRQVFERQTRFEARIKALQQGFAEEIQQRRSVLSDALGSLADDHPMQQYRGLTAKFELLAATLAAKFDVNEMTYLRYLGTAEQVYLGGLDNLQMVVDAAAALATVDEVALARRRDDCVVQGRAKEVALLNERLRIAQGYRQRIDMALADNEEAITRLSQVHEALIGLNTGQGLARHPLDVAMTELQRLAGRTAEYGRQAEK